MLLTTVCACVWLYQQAMRLLVSTTSALKYCSYCMKHKQISKVMIIHSVHMEVLEGQVRDQTLPVIPPVYN